MRKRNPKGYMTPKIHKLRYRVVQRNLLMNLG